MRRFPLAIRILLVCSGGLTGLGCGTDHSSGSGQKSVSLQLVGSISNLFVEDVVVAGNLAYVADQDSVLLVIDVTDRAAPVVLGAVGKTGGENGVALALAAPYAYVAVEADGLYIVDVSQPGNPTTVGIFPGAYAKDVAVVGNLAYVADQDYGLRIVDVSDAAAPVLRGSAATDGPFGVAVAGHYAYCADNDSGFVVVDVTNPTAPFVVGRYRALQSTRQVAVQGNYAFLDDHEAGPVILDVSNPAYPRLAASYPGLCQHLRADGDFLFVSMGYPNGLAAFDISHSTSPALLDTVATPTITEGLDVDADYVYVAANQQFLIYSR
jgi:hypothetical protein